MNALTARWLRLIVLVLGTLAGRTAIAGGIPYNGTITKAEPNLIATLVDTEVTLTVQNTASSTYFQVELISTPPGWTITNLTPDKVFINFSETGKFKFRMNPADTRGDYNVKFRLYAYEFLTDPVVKEEKNLTITAKPVPGDFLILDPIEGQVLEGPFQIRWTIPPFDLKYRLRIYETNNQDLVTPPVLDAKDLTTTNYNYDTSLLVKGKEYAIRVTAINEVGEADSLDGVRRFIVQSPFPVGPFSLLDPVANDTMSPKPTFSWTPSEHAVSYRLTVLPKINGVPGTPPVRVVSGITGTSYTWADPQIPAGNYYVSVFAVGETNELLNSEGLVPFFVSSLTPFKLQSPAVNSVKAPRQPVFKWEGSFSAESYDFIMLRQRDDDLLEYFHFATVPEDGTTVDYQIPAEKTLETSRTYYWYVIAHNSVEQLFNQEGPIRFTTTDLDDFTLFTPAPLSEGVLRNPFFEWTAAPGSLGYTVEVAPLLANGTPDFARIRRSPFYLQELRWDLTGPPLDTNKGYAWRVAATDGPNTLYNYGSWQKFKTTPFEANPTLLEPGTGQTNVSVQPVFSWNALPGAQRYRLHLTIKDRFEIPPFETLDATARIDLRDFDVRLNSLTTYQWYVEAISGTVEVASDVREFKTGVRSTPPTPCDYIEHLLGLQILSPQEIDLIGAFAPYDIAYYYKFIAFPEVEPCDAVRQP